MSEDMKNGIRVGVENGSDILGCRRVGGVVVFQYEGPLCYVPHRSDQVVAVQFDVF